MPEKHIYEYACIRYVPRVEREEFINVGVILYCKATQFLGVKYEVDAKRISAFSAALSPEQLGIHLHTWELICRGDKEGGKIAELDVAGRFRWLTAVRSTIVQSSKVHPGRCSQPSQVLDRLFHQYVSQPS